MEVEESKQVSFRCHRELVRELDKYIEFGWKGRVFTLMVQLVITIFRAGKGGEFFRVAYRDRPDLAEFQKLVASLTEEEITNGYVARSNSTVR